MQYQTWDARQLGLEFGIYPFRYGRIKIIQTTEKRSEYIIIIIFYWWYSFLSRYVSFLAPCSHTHAHLVPQHQFVVDEVSTIIKESIETVIGGNAYTSAKVNNWTSQVVENVLGNLSKLNKAFKYIGESATTNYSGFTCYYLYIQTGVDTAIRISKLVMWINKSFDSPVTSGLRK